jgi:ubiquinone/menaquinone biosynthesis C-methylase UbiE
MVDDSYDSYVRAEWAMRSSDPSRDAAAHEALAGLPIRRVLDVGCGAGQELRPFVRDGISFGIGVDVSPDVGAAGRQLFARDEPASRVAFVRAAAEQLPFGASTFDLITCRLALPYTDNARALAEIARVLRPGGALVLKFHHAVFYALELRRALVRGNFKPAVHACRVLAAGCLYHLTGSQPHGRFVGNETFQTLWLLRRELGRNRLRVRRLLDDSVPAAPTLLALRE